MSSTRTASHRPAKGMRGQPGNPRHQQPQKSRRPARKPEPPAGRARMIGAALVAVTLVLGIIGIALAVHSASSKPATTSIVQMTPTQAQKVIAAHAHDRAFHIIDVRRPDEFAAGHIAHAMNVDVEASTFSARIQKLDPHATYFVYCHSGRRSAIATNEMHALGFTHVDNLEGGLSAWEAAGLPTT